MASELLLFAASLCIAGSGFGAIATDEYAVELSLISKNESEIVYTCHTDVTTESPAWEIDSISYRVTDLPFGHTATANRLRIHPYGNTTIRCFFLTFTNRTFVPLYSDSAEIEHPTYDRVDIGDCDPENISILFNESLFDITWDIASYRSDCSFIANVSNCSNPEQHCRDFNVTIHNHKVKLSLHECVAQDLVYPTGLIIDVKWNSSKCAIGDNGCSKKMYIPDLKTTENIMIQTDGLFLNLSSPYSDGYTNLLFCFESLTLVNGCFNVAQLQTHFYVKPCASNSPHFCLGVKDVNPMLNETIVTVYTIDNTETPCNPGKNIDTLLFNFILLVDNNGTLSCKNCSPNAECKNGECVCKEGFTGDGMSCDLDWIIFGPVAAGFTIVLFGIIPAIILCCLCYRKKHWQSETISGRNQAVQ